MAVRLRDNAAALTNLQLAMLSAGSADIAALAPEPSPEPVTERFVERRPAPASEDRVLSGDALSRFVSRKLDADESPHEIWQDLHDVQPAKRRRNPAATKSGFRSKPG